MKNYKLNIPWFHGNAGKEDIFCFLSFEYKNAINSKKTKLTNYCYFKKETDRYNYWKFWTGDLGRICSSMWKYDPNAHPQKFISYKYWNTDEECLKYFNISKEDILKIKDIIWNIKKYEDSYKI